MNTVPITVLVDDREKAPYTFTDIELSPLTLDQLDGAAMVSDTSDHVTRYEVTTIRQRLTTGDYSLPLASERVAVSRKSLHDLYSTLTNPERTDLFWEELKRLHAMESACVVVEEDWKNTPPPSGFTPTHSYRIIGLIGQYQCVFPKVMWGYPSGNLSQGRRGGEIATFLFLLAFHDRLQKEEGATPPR